MDYDKKFDEYTYGYTTIVVQVCGDLINVFTQDHRTAKGALDCYEDWVAFFAKLSEKHPIANPQHKIQIKRMLNWKAGEHYTLQDFTIEELKSKVE